MRAGTISAVSVTSDGRLSVPNIEVRVDLDAIAANVRTLREYAGDADLMAVVKGDAYGHGLVPIARAARGAGATWLGTAVLAEALQLRAAGDTGRLMAWLTTPGERWIDAIAADIDVSASAQWALDEIVAAAHHAGRTARVHLKIDTGLGRGGATFDEWSTLVDAALKAQTSGAVHIVGIWSHLTNADTPGDPMTTSQLALFDDAVTLAEARGLEPEVRHIANSGATLTVAEARLDLVRTGIAMYGLTPAPDYASAEDFGLRPAMTASSRLALVKRVSAGQGVSYGHRYVTDRETTLGLVPVGYADGVTRHGSGGTAGPGAPVLAAGAVRPVAGRVCMDQFVIDLGDDDAKAGDVVVLFGDPARGEPSAQDWADAAGTISYEIVTRLAPRVARTYVGGSTMGTT